MYRKIYVKIFSNYPDAFSLTAVIITLFMACSTNGGEEKCI
jgi:hypothetical protein